MRELLHPTAVAVIPRQLAIAISCNVVVLMAREERVVSWKMVMVGVVGRGVTVGDTPGRRQYGY